MVSDFNFLLDKRHGTAQCVERGAAQYSLSIVLLPQRKHSTHRHAWSKQTFLSLAIPSKLFFATIVSLKFYQHFFWCCADLSKNVFFLLQKVINFLEWAKIAISRWLCTANFKYFKGAASRFRKRKASVIVVFRLSRPKTTDTKKKEFRKNI